MAFAGLRCDAPDTGVHEEPRVPTSIARCCAHGRVFLSEESRPAHVQASQQLTRGPQHRPAHAQNENGPSGFAPETRSVELPELHWGGGTHVSDSNGILPSRCSLAKKEKGAVLSYSRLTTVTVTKHARPRESRSLHCSVCLFSKHIRGLFLQLLEMIMGDTCPFLSVHTRRHACTYTYICAHTCAHTHTRTHTRTRT